MVVVASVYLVACGDDVEPDEQSSTDVPAEAVLPRALSGPGSELGDGFTVADGSALIGAPVPLGTTSVVDGTPVVDEGWKAHLFVSGDPSEVVEAYLEQARAAGMEVNPVPDDEPFAMEGEENPPSGYYMCAAVGDMSVECGATAGDAEGRCLNLDLVRSGRASHLALTLSTNDPFVCEAPSGLAGNSAEDPPSPSTWPDLPGEGNPLGEPWGSLAPIEVQEGSTVVAAPVARLGCGVVGALLEVEGDPREVAARYAAEIERISRVELGVTTEEVRSGGRTLRRHIAQEGGGGRRFEIDLVTGEDDTAWLYLSGCEG